MDPDKTLEILRGYAENILDLDHDVDIQVAEDMAIEFQALDAWLTRGGFLPEAWQEKKHD